MLTYTGPDAELGSRGWYWAYPECNAAARAAYAEATGTVPACDEYPFYRTWEGGHTNYLAGKVSIRLVDFADNSVAGAMYGAFIAACRINKSERFRVVSVSGTSHATDKNGRPCL